MNREIPKKPNDRTNDGKYVEKKTTNDVDEKKICERATKSRRADESTNEWNEVKKKHRYKLDSNNNNEKKIIQNINWGVVTQKRRRRRSGENDGFLFTFVVAVAAAAAFSRRLLHFRFVSIRRFVRFAISCVCLVECVYILDITHLVCYSFASFIRLCFGRVGARARIKVSFVMRFVHISICALCRSFGSFVRSCGPCARPYVCHGNEKRQPSSSTRIRNSCVSIVCCLFSHLCFFFARLSAVSFESYFYSIGRSMVGRRSLSILCLTHFILFRFNLKIQCVGFYPQPSRLAICLGNMTWTELSWTSCDGTATASRRYLQAMQLLLAHIFFYSISSIRIKPKCLCAHARGGCVDTQ